MIWTAADALHAASTWLERQKVGIAGYRGAYVAGSVARLSGNEMLPVGSDVDVMVIADDEAYLGKSIQDGLVIEGTVLSATQALDPETVLADYHLAPGLAHAHILYDPRGDIARTRQTVLKRYREPETIAARLDHVESRARATLLSASAERTEAERLNAWQFGVGQIAHMMLVAALENPTVRKRYVASARVMEQQGEGVAYGRLLRLAGVNRIARPAVETLTRELDALLVRVGSIADGSSWRFASDISTPMRPIVMGGIRAMIQDGWYREAMFPITMTWCRCAQLLDMEAPNQAVGDTVSASLGILRSALRVAADPEMTEAVADAQEAIPAFRAIADRIAL